MFYAMAASAAVGLISGIIKQRAAKREYEQQMKDRANNIARAEGYAKGLEPLRQEAMDVASGKKKGAAETMQEKALQESTKQVMGLGASRGPLAFRQAIRQKQQVDNGMSGELAAVRAEEQARAVNQAAAIGSMQYDARNGASSATPSYSKGGAFMEGFGPGFSSAMSVAGPILGGPKSKKTDPKAEADQARRDAYANSISGGTSYNALYPSPTGSKRNW